MNRFTATYLGITDTGAVVECLKTTTNNPPRTIEENGVTLRRVSTAQYYENKLVAASGKRSPRVEQTHASGESTDWLKIAYSHCAPESK